MKKILEKTIILLASSLLWSGTLYGKEKVTTLTLHHFLSATSPAQRDFLEPWAKKLEKDSKGRIKVEIFPSMSMGGKPNELYSQVRSGSADIVWTVAGYTAGVFPRSEVFELPTVHLGDSTKTSMAIHENFDLIKDDFTDVKPLLVHVAAGNSLHMVDKRITTIKDLKGLKLRSPARTGAWYIEELGAEAVGMSMPSVPSALSKNAIDGAILPFEAFPPFKFQQLTKYSTLGHNGERFGTSVFLFLMNQDKFKSLPKDLQKIIEKSVDIKMAKEVGKLWMDNDEVGIALQKASPDSEVIILSEEETNKLNNIGEKVVKRWVTEANEKGLKGQELVDKARKAILEQ